MGDTRKEEAELSLRKKYHKTIFSRFARAINTYRLVEDGDLQIILERTVQFEFITLIIL